MKSVGFRRSFFVLVWVIVILLSETTAVPKWKTIDLSKYVDPELLTPFITALFAPGDNGEKKEEVIGKTWDDFGYERLFAQMRSEFYDALIEEVIAMEEDPGTDPAKLNHLHSLIPPTAYDVMTKLRKKLPSFDKLENLNIEYGMVYLATELVKIVLNDAT